LKGIRKIGDGGDGGDGGPNTYPSYYIEAIQMVSSFLNCQKIITKFIIAMSNKAERQNNPA